MADADPFSEVFNLFAAPIAGTMRSVEQFRKGVDEFLRAVENLNNTMEGLNETTARINRLLEDVEEPLRAALPQVTRTIRTADEVIQVVSGPAMAAAPALKQIAETLTTPAFEQLPARLTTFTDLLGDVSKSVRPLTQLAESTGGLFGGLRFPGRQASPPAPAPATPAPQPSSAPPTNAPSAAAASPRSAAATPVERAAVKRAAAKKTAAKRRGAKKPAAKKTASKTSTSKKTAARK